MGHQTHCQKHTNKDVAVGAHGGVSAAGIVLHGHLQSQQRLSAIALVS